MNNHLQWTSTIVRSLYAQGVRHAIISPGSRSTALTLAFANHPGIESSVVLDERSAAFIALGIAKKSGLPAALVCTSGTAAANYYPAVIEAKQSGVPMIVLSADRPPHLRGIGSSQTIDQIKLFGDHAVFFHEAGEPILHDVDLKRISYAVKQAVQTSISAGGTAHINLPFRKPFEPTTEQLNTESSLNNKQIEESPSLDRTSKSTIQLGESLQELIITSRFPVIIAGPANPHHALKELVNSLSAQLSAPVLAEPGSGVDSDNVGIIHFEQFLRIDRHLTELKPDLIIRIGDQPFTKSITSALEYWDSVPVIHFSARNSAQDQQMNISHSVHLSAKDNLDLDFINPKYKNDEWLSSWKKMDSRFAENLRKEILKPNTLTDGHVFSHFGNELTKSWNVMISNSLPVRDMALFAQSRANQFVNRGAAGIDGILSTAAGIALASKKPTCCFIGDLAFLHDSNALLSLKSVSTPFLIIVVNNNGGNIFRMLPVYQQNRADYTTYFETPQHVNIEFIAKANGISCKKVDSLSSLFDAEINSLSNGPAIVECVTNANESMSLRNNLWNP